MKLIFGDCQWKEAFQMTKFSFSAFQFFDSKANTRLTSTRGGRKLAGSENM